MKKYTQHACLRNGSVYIAVTGTALLISLIGFTSLHLSRLEIRKIGVQNERAYARQLAHSGVELALARIDLDSSWRDSYSHGELKSAEPSGIDEDIFFRLLDNHNGNRDGGDEDLANDATDSVEIQGIGRYGSATFVYSALYASSPSVLSSYDSTGGNGATGEIRNGYWLGQYFVPSLPAGTTEWSVIRVDIYAQRHDTSNANLDIRLYEDDGAGMPATELETNSLDPSSLPTSFDWVSVDFANVTGRVVDTGLCLGLGNTNVSERVDVRYESTGVSHATDHFLEGSSSGWTSSDSNKALWFRIHGHYTTATGSTEDFTLIPGSWQSTEAP